MTAMCPSPPTRPRTDLLTATRPCAAKRNAGLPALNFGPQASIRLSQASVHTHSPMAFTMGTSNRLPFFSRARIFAVTPITSEREPIFPTTDNHVPYAL